jgi:hypothetical protein
MTYLTLCHNVLTKEGWVRSIKLDNTHDIAVLDKNYNMYYTNLKTIEIKEKCNVPMCIIMSKDVNIYISLDANISSKIHDNFLDIPLTQTGMCFNIMKTSNGLLNNDKYNELVGLYKNSGSIYCSDLKESDKLQVSLIECGYCVDREQIFKFNSVLGYKLNYNIENMGYVNNDDYTSVSTEHNHIFKLNLLDKDAKYVCVERYDKTAWVEI